MRPTPPHQMPALLLGWIFLRIGATALGGLGTILPLIERELMMKRRECTRNALESKWRETMVSGCKGASVHGRNLGTHVCCANV
jgi:hypothetical protein